jgi:hypothetical protein
MWAITLVRSLIHTRFGMECCQERVCPLLHELDGHLSHHVAMELLSFVKITEASTDLANVLK